GLPRGYDTQVGERGVQLSGGQRQRIALARAFLQDSPILILDEPTNAVDTESESAILAAIKRLMRGRTVLVITHRSSMLDGCAALVAIENGRVVADAARAPASTSPSPTPSAVRKRPSNVLNHPAARAWCELYPGVEPLQITPLRVRKRKNKIYRIDFAGRSGVVAKRGLKEGALIERAVYERVLPCVAVPTLGYHVLLERHQARLCDVAAHWDRLEEVCEGAPRTLVHGDFNGKNLRLRSENGHSTIVVFDWEAAGWGVPAADLAQAAQFSRLSASPDLPSYWSMVRERWPNASPEALERLAHCGSAFRALAGLSWELPNLASDWAHAC